jgi:hypothetical protein
MRPASRPRAAKPNRRSDSAPIRPCGGSGEAPPRRLGKGYLMIGLELALVLLGVFALAAAISWMLTA